jgi:hypothetical protein
MFKVTPTPELYTLSTFADRPFISTIIHGYSIGMSIRMLIDEEHLDFVKYLQLYLARNGQLPNWESYWTSIPLNVTLTETYPHLHDTFNTCYENITVDQLLDILYEWRNTAIIQHAQPIAVEATDSGLGLNFQFTQCVISVVPPFGVMLLIYTTLLVGVIIG